MPRVPLIERQDQTRAMPVVELGKVGNPYIAGVGAEKAVDALTKAVQEGQERANQVSIIEAQRKIDEWEAKNLFDPANGAFAKKGKSAFALPDTLTGQYDNDMKGISDSLTNDDQRLAFQKMAQSRRGSWMQSVQTHVRGEMDQYGQSEADAGVKSANNRAALFYNIPHVRDAALQQGKDTYEAWALKNGKSPEEIANKKLDIESDGLATVLTRMSDVDPKGAVQFYKDNITRFNAPDLLRAQALMAPTERKYKANELAKGALGSAIPKTTQASAIDYIMNDIEGGDKVVPDGKGVAKFGINSAANGMTDDAVSKLTPEEAKEFYTKKWAANKIDDLPADMRLLAFDTLVNHGEGKGNELIDAAGNDPRKLLELRGEEYKRLAKADPDQYGPNYEGWMNRLGKVGGQIDAMRGAIPDKAEIYAKIDAGTDDIDVATAAKKMVDDNLQAIVASKKSNEDGASDEAWKYRQQGLDVPASVEARMNPKEAFEMRSNAPPDPFVYEDARRKIVTGQPVDLKPIRWQLGNKFDDLLQLQQDPTKMVNARKVDDVVKDAQKILLGKSEAKSEEDLLKVEQFRRAVDDEINQYQKGAGKIANAEDVQKITDRLLLKVSKTNRFWDDDARMFQIRPGDAYTTEGIPDDRIFMVAGQQIAYDTLVRNLTSILNAKNVPINGDTLEQAYSALVKSGKLVEQRKQ